MSLFEITGIIAKFDLEIESICKMTSH